MKKFISIVAAVATVVFVGCSKDDDLKPSTDNIAGSWEVYKEYWEEEWVDDGEKFSDNNWEDYDEGEMVYTFEKNGLFTLTMDGKYRESGSYTLNGKILTVAYSDVNNTYTIKSLTSNELVLVEKEEYQDYKGYTELYLKRIK